MPYRKTPLVEEEIYHIFTKSIAGFKIFNSDKDFQRMLGTITFYTIENPPCKFSLFLQRREERSSGIPNPPIPNPHWNFDSNAGLELAPEKLVRILAYCLMPTHIHLILKQLKDNGISRFANLILKSYSKYFNTKHDRKGPLWEGRFKAVRVETDEQFLHLTRYIHLNPVTAFLVDNPEDWKFSSYREYIGLIEDSERICNFSEYLDMSTSSYQEFVNDQIDYQRELGRIKHLTLE